MSWFKASIRRLRRLIPQTYEEYYVVHEGTEASLLREKWYHGTLPREGVHALLHGDGEFLVRRSKNPDTDEPWYVISVKFPGGYKHYTIQGEEIIRDLELSGDPGLSNGDVRLKMAVPLQDWELRHDDLQLHDLLGQGTYRQTRRATLNHGKTEVAVKVISKNTSHSQLVKEHFHEAFTLRKLDHPNIVKFVGIAVLRQPFMVAMEYAPVDKASHNFSVVCRQFYGQMGISAYNVIKGGDLLTYLRKSGSKLSRKKKLRICLHVVSGMTHLEVKNVVHGDLAARNCLVGRSDVIKISDFLCSRPNDDVFPSPARLPVKWCAPEALNTGHLTFASDAWSFGILIWEVFSWGSVPYPGLTNRDARKKIDEGYRMPAPVGTPDEVYKIMMSCWEAQAEERPDSQTLHDALSYLYEQ